MTVRSLAGHSDKVTVKPNDTIGEITDKEVEHFIKKGWGPTAGDYSLTLPRISGNKPTRPRPSETSGSSKATFWC